MNDFITAMLGTEADEATVAAQEAQLQEASETKDQD